jgi:hypothetical protein
MDERLCDTDSRESYGPQRRQGDAPLQRTADVYVACVRLSFFIGQVGTGIDPADVLVVLLTAGSRSDLERDIGSHPSSFQPLEEPTIRVQGLAAARAPELFF